MDLKVLDSQSFKNGQAGFIDVQRLTQLRVWCAIYSADLDTQTVGEDIQAGKNMQHVRTKTTTWMWSFRRNAWSFLYSLEADLPPNVKLINQRWWASLICKWLYFNTYCKVQSAPKNASAVGLCVHLKTVICQQFQIGQMIDDLTVNLSAVQSLQPLKYMNTKWIRTALQLTVQWVQYLSCSVSYQNAALLIQFTSRREQSSCSTCHLKQQKTGRHTRMNIHNIHRAWFINIPHKKHKIAHAAKILHKWLVLDLGVIYWDCACKW